MPLPDLGALKLDRNAPTTSRRSKWKWLALALVLVAVLFFVATQRRVVEVEIAAVTTAYPYQGVTALNATGYVVAQRKASVASKATGRLEWLGVQEGSAVKQGEVIARLENADVRAQLDQARANVNVTQANVVQAQADRRDAELAYKRAKDLLAQKFVSAAQVDTAEARFRRADAAVASAKAAVMVAQAQVAAAQQAVEQTLIRSPFDGVVLTKNANVGDNITPFSAAADTKGAVVTLADMTTLEVEADVSESSLAKIQVGQPCEIQLDAYPQLRLRGEVSRLVPTVDRSKASVLTKIRFVEMPQNTDVKVLPEMSAKIAFLAKAVADDQRKALDVVPADAVTQRNGKPVVFAVQGTGDALTVKQIELTLGEKIGDLQAFANAKPELHAGDKLVLKPAADLADGAPVKAVQK